MKRLIEKTVFCALVTACRLAACPTRRSPLLVKATIDGVVRAPSEFSTTTGSPPSITAMHEFVVPRSIPRILAINRCKKHCKARASHLTKIKVLNANKLRTNGRDGGFSGCAILTLCATRTVPTCLGRASQLFSCQIEKIIIREIVTSSQSPVLHGAFHLNPSDFKMRLPI
jgi:hypothetical protein